MRRHILLSLALLAAQPAASAQDKQNNQDALDSAQRTSRQTTAEARASQERINSLSDATRKLLEDYRAQLWKAQQLQLYIRQLDATLEEQERRKQQIADQLERIDRTRAELVPMLVRMVDGLEQFIALDIPFLTEERGERITRLRALLSDPDIPVSEQYRRVFEAYQVEADYGRSLEAWRGALPGGAQLVDYLRVGRMAWYYLSLDGSGAWQYEAGANRWQPVPSQNLRAIRQGLRVANEQAAPELLALPVARP